MTTKTFTRPLDQKLLAQHIAPDATILDYGCGQGRLCGDLQQAGYEKVVGVDFSEAMIQQAREALPGMEFAVLDASGLNFPAASIDCGVEVMTMHGHRSGGVSVGAGEAVALMRANPTTRTRCMNHLEMMMRTMTVQQAKAHFGTFIDIAQKSPVRVVRDDRVVGVMVSGSDYEAMRVFYADRLVRTLERTAGPRRRVKTVWPRLRQTQFWLKPWLSIKVAIQRCGRHL